MSNTYSEQEGRPAIDWRRFLEDMIAGRESFMGWFVAMEHALDWVTCACGNQCSAIPRDRILGCPLDTVLCNLGRDFADCIEAYDWEEANNILDEIEARSTEILREMEATK